MFISTIFPQLFCNLCRYDTKIVNNTVAHQLTCINFSRNTIFFSLCWFLFSLLLLFILFSTFQVASRIKQKTTTTTNSIRAIFHSIPFTVIPHWPIQKLHFVRRQKQTPKQQYLFGFSFNILMLKLRFCVFFFSFVFA